MNTPILTPSATDPRISAFAHSAPHHPDAQPHSHWPLSTRRTGAPGWAEGGGVAEGRGGGRAISALRSFAQRATNATTHGLFARDVLLPVEEPELGIEVQRLVWRQLRPTPAPDIGDARLDTQVTPQADNVAPTDDSQNCQNEPGESQICQNELPVSSPPLLGAGGPPNPPILGGPQRSGEVGLPVTQHEICKNEP